MQPTKPRGTRTTPGSGKPLRSNASGLSHRHKLGASEDNAANKGTSTKKSATTLRSGNQLEFAATAPAAASPTSASLRGQNTHLEQPSPPPPQQRQQQVGREAAAGDLSSVPAATGQRRRPASMTATLGKSTIPGKGSMASPEDIFTVVPREVTFHGFEANRAYTSSLTFTNRTPQSQFICVARPPSRFFALTPPKGSDTTLKVAAGLSVVYTVVFTPEDAGTDYHCDLHVSTDHGAFVLPVRAHSSRGRLELPAELLIAQCPVKSSRSVPLFFRNTDATTPCVWRAEVLPEEEPRQQHHSQRFPGSAATEGVFVVSPNFGTVQPDGGSAAVEVLFTPDLDCPVGAQVTRTIRFHLGPEGDVVQDLVVRGTTCELPVSLVDAKLDFAPTFVTTERQGVVRVTNASDSIVRFAWKGQYADLLSAAAMGAATLPTSSVADSNENEAAPSLDGPFDDDVFSIEPALGVIYGRGSKEFTVTFNPQLAVTSTATAYLDVTGRAERLPLVLTGEGLGPQCKLDYSRLNIGEVYLNAEHEYIVELTNVGSIEARYTVVPPETKLARKFSFTPASGALAPGESQELRVLLKSDVMGVVSEKFRVHLHGSLTDLPLLFKGRVVGPTFLFDVNEVDYGDVSFGFWHSKVFTLTNTSHVPLHYGLRLSPECPYRSSFEIVPTSGTVAPLESKPVELRFFASTQGVVQTELLVDVVDVGTAVETLPVKARCEAPALHFSTEAVTFGHCFVGHDYTAHVEVVNDSDLSGRFAVVLTGDAETLRAQANVVIGKAGEAVAAGHDASEHGGGEKGELLLVIGPHERVQVPIHLSAVRVGSITFTVSLRVCGLDHHPASRGSGGGNSNKDDTEDDGEKDDSAQGTVDVTSHHKFRTALVTASARGPIIEVQPPSGVISFGTVPVLEPLEKTLVLHNTSPIPATFSVRLEKNAAGTPSAVFFLEPREGVIDPYGRSTITVRACVDEAMGFVDAILVDVAHSPDALEPITVKATGTGFPLVTDVDISNYDFGDVFTETKVERTVTVTNRGRKEQEVQWHNVRGSKVKEGAVPIVFSIKPERVLIGPRESVTFVVEGFARSMGTFCEEFFLKQSSTFKKIMDGKFTGNFMPPLLTYSTRSLSFDTFHATAKAVAASGGEGESPPTAAAAGVERKSFTVRNVTSKELQVHMKISEPAGTTPFSLDVEPTLTLAAGETRVIGVVFDPSYRPDCISHEVKARVRVTFAKHPRQETLTLFAKLAYPGVTLEPAAGSTVNFGVILKDTEERRTVTLTNPSDTLPAAFVWSLVGDNDGDEAAQPSDDKSALRETAPAGTVTTCTAATMDRTRCFDVIPFKGTLLPGASQTVEVAFYGSVGSHKATALCRVAGGATHALTLEGSAGEVQLQYDRRALDFGVMPYHEEAQKSVTISNPSRVAVAFQVALPPGMRHAKAIRVSPMSGVIHDKVKLTVTFCPVVPDEFHEAFTVQIAHFDPQPITVTGCGTVNTIALAGCDENGIVTRSTTFNPAYDAALAELKARTSSDVSIASREQQPTSQHRDPFVPYAIRTACSSDVVDMYKKQAHPDALEIEAERVAFCATLATVPPVIAQLSEPSRREVGDGPSDAQATEAVPTTAARTAHGSPTTAVSKADVKRFYQDHKSEDPLRRFSRRNSTTAMFDGTVKYVLARYTVDFGHMTRSETRTTRVRLSNTCSERLFLLLDQKELSATPISVIPSKVPQLEPLDSTTIDVTFDAAGAVMAQTSSGGGDGVKNNSNNNSGAPAEAASGGGAKHPPPTIHPGENLFEFAIDVKGGPVVVVQCRCYIATPVLRIQENALDFGKVLLGQAAIKSLTLRNDQAIPCEWRVTCKEPTGKKQPKRAGYLMGTGLSEGSTAGATLADKDHRDGSGGLSQQFWTDTGEGVVAPHGTTTIDVFFAPFLKTKSRATLTFRFLNNAKVHEVRCEGEAAELDVSISPSPLVMPVMRPQQVATATVTVTNHEAVPVEMYALETDRVYREETVVLRHAVAALGVGPEQRLLMPPRSATDALPDEVIEAAYAALGQQAALHTVDVGDIDLEANLREEAEGAATGGANSIEAQGSATNGKGGKAGKSAGSRGTKQQQPRRTSQTRSTLTGSRVDGNGATDAAMQSTLPPGTASQGREGGISGAASSGWGAGPVTVVLVGPPTAGKSTQTRLLQSRLGLDPIDLNALVLAEAERDTANGEVIRNILTILVRRVRPRERKEPRTPPPPPPPPHLSARDNGDAGSDEDEDDDGFPTFQDERFATRTWLQSAVASNEHLRTLLSPPINEDTGTLTPRTARSLASAGGAEEGTPPPDIGVADSLAPFERFIPGILKSLLRAEMESRMHGQRHSQDQTNPFDGFAAHCSGFLFDDLQCCLTANRRVVHDAVREVCDLLGSRLLIFSLAISEACVGLRRAIAEQQACQEHADAAFVAPLSEDDYELLGPAEREQYNVRLKYYNECRRDLNRATRLREHYEAILRGGPQVSVQEAIRAERALADSSKLETTTTTVHSRGGGGSRKTTHAKKTLEISEPTEPAWDDLDEMQSFRELWSYLLHLGQVAEQAPPLAKGAGSGKGGSSPATSGGRSATASGAGRKSVASAAGGTSTSSAFPTEMKGEQPVELLTDDLVRLMEAACTQSGTVPAATADVAHTASPAPARNENDKRNSAAENVQSPKVAAPTMSPARAEGSPSRGERGGVRWPELLSRTGGGSSHSRWTYLDAARFSALSNSSPSVHSALTKCVRFLAMVERAVAAPVTLTPAQMKKNANKAKPPPQTVRRQEPMTRWVIPAKSTLELTVEFRCDHAGNYSIPCDFGLVGSQQKVPLTLQGQVALPDMSRDDKSIFPNCRSKPPPTGRALAKVFWLTKRVFDFGPLLVPAPPAKRRKSDRGGALPSSNQAQAPSQQQQQQQEGGGGGSRATGSLSGSLAAATTDTLPPATSEEIVTFSNNGISDAEVTLSFEDDKNRGFSVSPVSFTLPVGGTEKVRLRANPETVGEITNRLVASVKDNANPWSVVVSCVGSRPSLTVDGRKDAEYDFGRSSLNRASRLSMTLANTCRMPVRWALVGVDKLPSELQVSETSGELDVSDTKEVTFTFCPTSTCLHSIPLQVQVTDASTGSTEASSAVYEVIPVTVKAEGHDVILEWTKEIDFRLMHVGETKRETFRVLNKSPYDVGFLIRLPKRLQGTISITPQSGTIRGMLGHKDAAVANVEVCAHFEKEGEIPKTLGQLEVAFFDPAADELVYPLQTVPVRGEAWYTRYSVKPNCIDFGPCFHDQRRQASFELRNTGRFPVTYALFDYTDGCDSLRKESAAATGGGGASDAPASIPATGASSHVSFTSNATIAASAGTGGALKKQPSSKNSKSVDGTECRLGCFTVSPARGVVPVGESVTLSVVAVPDAKSRNRETLGVYVGQSHPMLEDRGTPVELLAHPATPGIAADLTSSSDVETVFEEQQVVFRLAQFGWKAKAYGKEDRTFSFGTTLVGHRTEERFRIANISPLPCTVVAQIVSATGNLPVASGAGAGPKAGQAITRPEGFDIRYDGSTSRDAIYAGLVEEAAAAAAAAGGGGREGENRAAAPSARKNRAHAPANPEAGDAASATGGGAGLVPSPPGTVRLVLPPFESRFVTVGFTPGSLQRFEGRFLATVDNGSDALTNCLSFHLLGHGTLPSVEYILPPPLASRHATTATAAKPGGAAGYPSSPATATEGALQLQNRHGGRSSPSSAPLSTGSGKKSGSSKDKDGSGGGGGGGGAVQQSVIQLPLTRVGTHTSRCITIRNVGDVPADISVTLTSDEQLAAGLSFAKRNQDISIPVVSEEVFEIGYAPTVVGRASMKLRVALLDNPFEDKELVVEAQSFSQPLSFEGVDPATADFLDLGDCYADQPREQTFGIRNNTNSRLRFTWHCPGMSATNSPVATAGSPPSVVVQMTPSIGHIAPGTVKAVTARVVVAAGGGVDVPRGSAGSLSVVPCRLDAQSIELLGEDGEGLGGAMAEWDNSLMNEKWSVVANANAFGASSAGPYPSPTGNGAGARPYSALSGDAGRRNLRKIMEPVPEPGHHLTDAVVCEQPLRIGYVCDKPRYEVALVTKERGASTAQPLGAIAFETTKMFQRRIATVRVTNTGTVALPYNFRATQKTTAADKMGRDADARDRDGLPNTAPSSAIPNAFSEPGEFSVEPAEGVVPVGGFADVSVIFAPRAAAVATGTLAMDFPFSERPHAEVALSGSGECPLVHFHIPPSEYLDDRVDGEVGVIADPETLALEFLTRGLHNRTMVKFKVVNPTTFSYPFEWVDHSPTGTLPPFRCLTRAGTMEAGKELEMAFEFSADTLGTREAVWSFDIPGRASVPFLLVGKAIEPDVLFTTGKLNFGCVTLRHRVEKTIYLENRDDVPFGFAFDKLDGQGSTTVTATTVGGSATDDTHHRHDRKAAATSARNSYLSVKPATGVVAPKERLPITVTFCPTDEMEYNVPLVCRVKKASAPLTVNVKGEGISTHDSLYVEAPGVTGARDTCATAPPLIATKGQLLVLNLGRVQVDERVTRRFALTNTGQYPFDFAVSAPERRFITLENTQGSVAPKQRVIVTLTYHPTVEETLRQYRLTIKTGAGKPSYQVGVQAVAYIPKLSLSVDKVDFGPRFIAAYNPHHEPSTALTLTNNDKEVITVDCDMADGNGWCHLDSSSSLVVRPNESAELKLSFAPPDVRTYGGKLKLLLNGVYPVYVPISGEGVVPRVEVLNHVAKLGVARVGEKREVELRIACRSRIPTPVSFQGCVDDDLVQKGISIVSGQSLLLKPREVRVVTVAFKPTRRMGEFQREMKMLVCGRECPFVLLTGACEDAEIHLDTKQLTFADVVVGSSAMRRLVIMNSGDISQKFTWGLRHGGELAVSAPSGFVRAHTEFVCEVTYTPAHADSHLRRSVDITFDNSPPVTVMVEANAVPRPAAKSCVQFRCRARETDTQSVSVENTSSQPWSFTPVFEEGEEDDHPWSLPKGTELPITLKPKGKADVMVQYAPVKETREGALDVGTMFLPQPDGAGLTFTLEGRADAPGPSAPLSEVDLEAKTEHKMSLPIRNWAKVPVRFTREVVWSPDPEEGLITVRGPATFEVLPTATKEYPLELCCMREGTYRGTVYLRCVERPEMVQYFEIVLRVSGQPSASVSELRASVRSGASHSIPVSNPLSKPVTVQIKTELVAGAAGGDGAGGNPPTSAAAAAAGSSLSASLSDYFIVPATLTVPAKSAVNLPVQFFPLVLRDYAPVRVLISSAELGVSRYTFRLAVSAAAPLEKTTRLICPLGQSITFALRFTHFCRSNAEFAVHLSNSSSSSSSSVPRQRGVPSTAGSATERVGTPNAAAASVISINRGSAGGAANATASSSSSVLKVPGCAGWPRGQEVGLEFTYEPQAVGTVKDTVEFSSATGGTYTFPVVATCTGPERQGPIAIKAGAQSTQVPFKNVFTEPVTITVSTDNPSCFVVPKKSEVVAAKKSVNITVQFKPASANPSRGSGNEDHGDNNVAGSGGGDIARGKLMISCVPPGESAAVEWVYYLEAGRSEKDGVGSRRATVKRK